MTSRGQDGFNIYMKKYLRDVQMYLHRFCERLQKWLQFITPPCILAFDNLTVRLLPSGSRGYVLPLEPEFAVRLALATRVQEQWGWVLSLWLKKPCTLPFTHSFWTLLLHMKQAQPSVAWLVSVANPNWPESSWPASSLHYMNESNQDQSSLAQSRRTVQSSHTE